MNKRGVIKIGAISLILTLILILVFSSVFSTASTQSSYFVGEELKLDLSDYTSCILKIKTPSGEEVQKDCIDKFSFKFEESGNYSVSIKSLDSFERLEFEVYPEKEIGLEAPISEEKLTEISLEIESSKEAFIFNFQNGTTYVLGNQLKFNFNNFGNYELEIISPSGKRTSRVSSNDWFLFELLEEGEYSIKLTRGNGVFYYNIKVIKFIYPKLIQGKAEIGKPVNWIKKVNLSEDGNFLEIPSTLSIELIDEKGELFTNYSLVKVNEKNYILITSNFSETLSLDYITEAPLINEEVISETKKQITVSSPEDIHYNNVLSYSSISERLLIGQEGLIKIYWKENNTYLDFNASDTDGNGFLDYVEWIIPHLSTQTFEIILITKAEHLDSNKYFISNIYQDVKELDDVWSETISDNEYVRVTFEIPLNNTRDITVFPRVTSGNPVIEVYEKDSSEKIAEFSSLVSNEYNKVYLINLISDIQDTFDLKIVGGSVQFDHIIDPTISYNFNDRTRNKAYNYTAGSANQWATGTELPAGGYTNLISINNQNATITSGGNNDYVMLRFIFNINETAQTISNLNITLNGGETCSGTVTAFVFNWNTQSFTSIENIPASKGTITLNLSGTDVMNHLGTNNNLTILVDNAADNNCDNGQQVRIDYIDVDVTYSTDPFFIMFEDDFEGTLGLWTTDWTLSTTQAVSPTHSVRADSGTNDLVSDGVDMSNASSISVYFRYYITGIDGDDNINLYFYDGSNYDLIDEIGDDAEGEWLTFYYTTTDSQYFDNGFNIYIEGTSIDNNEYLYIDDVRIEKKTDTTPPTYSQVSVNQTGAGEITRFSVNVNDNYALESDGGYIFSTNNSGSWVNDSFVLFTETPSWANSSKILNSNIGERVGYRWYFNDTKGNLNSTQIYTLLTTDLTPPYFIYIPPNASLIYGDSLGVDFDASDNGGFGYYRINDTTRFSINQSGYLSNRTPMAAGNYEINISINDTSNNLNWIRYRIQVNKSPENCQILFNESSPLNYPKRFLVWANCTTPFTLRRNGTIISNNSEQVLAIGTYNFSMFRTDSQNYSIAFNQSNFVILPAVDNLAPFVFLNSPKGGTFPDVTPLMNVSLNETVHTLWYNLNNGENITICNSCSGTREFFLYLEEGEQTLNVYANDSSGETGINSSTFTVDFNYNYYDNFTDNSSLLENQLNRVTWNPGSINFSSTKLRVFSEGFESTLAQWETTAWDLSGARYHDGDQSILASNGNEGNLDSNSMDTSQADFINVSFWFNEDDLEDANIALYFYDGTNWDLIDEFGEDQATEDTWYYKEYTTLDTQYMIPNFAIRFDAGLGNGENVWIDQLNISSTKMRGNFTVFGAGLTSNIIEFTNITWDEQGTDENNNITIQVSTDNGINWYTATKNQGLTGVISDNGLVYRAFFSANQSDMNLSLLSINISWSDVINPPPNITINSPTPGITADVSPTLNVTIDGSATSLFYNVNGGTNTTICTDCLAGEHTTFVYLSEGDYTINVYSADIYNNQNSALVSFKIETNNNHFESYLDNSSLLGGIMNNLVWEPGFVSLDADLNFRKSLDETFEDDSYSDDNPVTWTVVSNAAGCSWNIVEGILTESSGCDDGNRDTTAFGGYIYPGNRTWTNINLTTMIRNSDNDGIGVMFRYINDSNYYRVRFEGTSNYRRLEKIQGGAVTILDSDTLTDGGLTQGTWFELKISLNGNSIDIYLNDTKILNATDTAFDYGSIALYSWDQNTGSYGSDFENLLVQDFGVVSGNFTAYNINVTETITEITNVTWDEYGTDSENNKINVEISADGGNNWHSAIKNQGLSLTGTGSSLVYRVLFDSNKTTPISFSNLNISWSDIAPSAVYVSILEPINKSILADVTPTLNLSIDGLANTLWYNVNNGENITVCTGCSPGLHTEYMHLYEGDFNLTVYVNNSAGILNSNLSTFTVDLNNNYYDTFNDNSSILFNQINNLNWYLGEINFFSPNAVIFSEGFESTLAQWETTAWDLSGARYHDGDQSILASNGNEGNLDSDSMDTSQADFINVSFWFNEDDLEDADIDIYFYDGSNWDLIDEVGADYATEDTWYYKTYITTDSQYMIPDFAIRFNANLGTGENVWIDELNISSVNKGNFTAYKINVLDPITLINNITWNSSGDSGTDALDIELSFDGGNTWFDTTNGQQLSGFAPNTTMYYRALFSTRDYANITLSSINISWSAAPSVHILYPIDGVYQSTITQLNYTAIVAGGNPSACWWTNNSGVTNYTITCGQNITTSSVEGQNIWTVYANDSEGAIGYDTVIFTVDTSAPEIIFINQTNEQGENVTLSNPLEQGKNLTININVNDNSIDKVWVIVWETIAGGVEKIRTFFTNLGNFLWRGEISTDETWNLSEYNYTIYANDTGNLNDSYEGNFSILNLISSIDLNPDITDGSGNVTISGTLNYSNGTVLGNYPINLWQDDVLLWFSNITAIGSYDFYQNKTNKNTTDFEIGDFYNTEENEGNVIITAGETFGNYTNILDAGALVDWDLFSWESIGQSCNTTLSWQDGYENFYGTHDAYIDATFPNTNYEDTDMLFVDTSPTQRALIKFDVFGKGGRKIPYNSTIYWANITINLIDATTDLVNVYEILEDWNESQVNYNNRLTGIPWSSTGVANTPSRSATLESSFTPSIIGNNNFSIINSMNFWADQSHSNYGVVLNPGGSNTLEFYSSEYLTQEENRPNLTVAFSSEDCTNIVMYVRLSNNKITWTDWHEISNSSSINDNGLKYRYLQYRADMGSVNSTLTPRLQSISANYTAVVTDSSGKYSYNISSPAMFGIYSIKMNTSLRSIVTSSIANLDVQAGMAPNVFLISPTTGIWFNYSNLTLVYNVSDLNNDLIFSELIINGKVNQTNSTLLINYAYNNFTINFSSGEYNWTVNVTDSLGYFHTPANYTFYIDLENPVVNLIYPGDETTYSASNLNLGFNVTDNMDSNLTCDIMLDGEIIHPGVSVPNATDVNYSSGSLESGIHHWNVTCFDESLRSYTSPTYQFDINDLPPVAYLFYPEEDYFSDIGDISFLFNVSEDISLINCSLVLNETYIITNQSEISTDIEDLNQIDIFGLSEGYYNWTVECYDNNLNYFKNSSIRNFSVDLSPPTIDLNLPSSGSTLTTSNANFNFTANDSIDTNLSCEIIINSEVADSFNAISGGLTNIPVSGLTDGDKYWNVTCIDNASHSNTSETRLVTIAEPPKVFINTTNLTLSSSDTVTIEYTPYDNTGLSLCTIYLNGLLNNSNSSEIINSDSNDIEIVGLTDGYYDYYINCSDYFSLSSISPINRFYVDTHAPIINLTSPDNETVFDTNVTFNFTALDWVDDSLNCNIFIDDEIVDENFTVQNSTPISREIAEIPDGPHTWYVTCEDSAGNSGISLIYNFTRSTAPEVLLVDPSSGRWLNYTPFNLTYYIQDDEGFSISYLIINGSVNRTNSSELVADQDNIFNITDFSDGFYNWTVIATDLGGINGTDTVRTFYLDTHPPQVILNFPNISEEIATNNVTINYTVMDNMDYEIFCQLYLDGSPEDSANVTNATNKIIYQLIGDGNHTWYVNCTDEAKNTNITLSRNFTVEAPPSVSLTFPPNNNITSSSSINLTYIPFDPIGIKQCNLILDGFLNDSSTSISPNQNNTFNLSGISEGMHNWTVNCSDSDYNWNWSTERIFYRDLSPPSIILNSPYNDSGIDFNNDRVYFNWTGIDLLDTILQCNLTVDGIVREPNIWVTNGTPKREYIFTSVLGQGEHSWNVTCWDQMKNVNTSELRKFNLTYPDFSVSSSEIFLNESNPKENQSIEITATVHNLAGADINNVTVKFYNGDPDFDGTQIGANIFVNLSKFSQVNVSEDWISSIGPSNIFVVIDPPLASNGSFKELNESNNKAGKGINVGSWHFFYGDVLTFSDMVLSNSNESKLINWDGENFNTGNVYVADYDSYISWNSLQAIGKNKLGADSSSDFSEIDSALNSSLYEDSVYSVYTNYGTQKYETNLYCFNKLIYEIPVINSTNNSNFFTGVLWDTSDDNNGTSGEFDLGDKEDIIFIAPINKHAQGTYGFYDYEIRVPAKLREYRTADLKTAAFYLEIS